MTAPHLPVIGLCRFSYPAEGGFQTEHDTLTARQAHLYDPARMEERFRLFQHVTLPGIAAQSDGDFRLGVLVGTDLPEPMLERLLSLIEPVRQAVLIPRPPGLPHREVLREAMLELRGGASKPCLQFRHDDDDAMNLDFIRLLRETAADCAGLIERHRWVGFDFARGYVARFGAEGIRARDEVMPSMGLCLAMSVKAGDRRCIFNFSHNRLGQNMPMVTRPDPEMWVRTYNDWNDTNARRKGDGPDIALADAATEARLAACFGIDAGAVRAAWS